jgi:hypothetical protein
MGRLLKCISVVQALLLLPFAISKPGDAAPSPDSPEKAAWEESVLIGTPVAFQQFISRFPQGDRIDDAFDMIIDSQVVAAQALARRGALDVQLAQSATESDLGAPSLKDLSNVDPY